MPLHGGQPETVDRPRRRRRRTVRSTSCAPPDASDVQAIQIQSRWAKSPRNRNGCRTLHRGARPAGSAPVRRAPRWRIAPGQRWALLHPEGEQVGRGAEQGAGHPMADLVNEDGDSGAQKHARRQLLLRIERVSARRGAPPAVPGLGRSPCLEVSIRDARQAGRIRVAARRRGRGSRRPPRRTARRFRKHVAPARATPGRLLCSGGVTTVAVPPGSGVAVPSDDPRPEEWAGASRPARRGSDGAAVCGWSPTGGVGQGVGDEASGPARQRLVRPWLRRLVERRVAVAAQHVTADLVVLHLDLTVGQALVQDPLGVGRAAVGAAAALRARDWARATPWRSSPSSSRTSRPGRRARQGSRGTGASRTVRPSRAGSCGLRLLVVPCVSPLLRLFRCALSGSNGARRSQEHNCQDAVNPLGIRTQCSSRLRRSSPGHPGQSRP